MNRKIFIIFTLMILVIGFIIPANAFEAPINFKKEITQSNHLKSLFPGCMEGDTLKFGFDVYQEPNLTYKKINLISNTEDLISLIQLLNGEIYLGYLENLIAFGPRLTTTIECEQAGDYIYNEFDKLDLDTRYQYWDNGYISGKNIEATLHGIDRSSDKIYIICAHYDTVTSSPGADDDGSGVALVLSAAKIMRHAKFNDTIRFVAFSGEEQGLIGSSYYVQEAVQNNDNIVAVFNADMIGYAEDENDASKLKIYDGGEYYNSNWITDYIISINKEYNEIFNLEILPSGFSGGSDHYYFWESGYSAIFAHEYHFNKYYHSSNDTIEHMNINYTIRNSKLLIATLAEVSGFITLNAPYKPNKPSGPLNGQINIEYNYSTTSIDPNGEQLYYLFDWGDGTNSGWFGPYTSGETISSKHMWTEKGNYKIKAKAKNINEYESEWSDDLSINLPKNKVNLFTIFINLLKKIISSLQFIRGLYI